MWSELAAESADAKVFWTRVHDSDRSRFIRLGAQEPSPGQPRHLYEVFGGGRLHARCCHWTDAMALAALGATLEPHLGFEVTKTTEWSLTNRYRETIAAWGAR